MLLCSVCRTNVCLRVSVSITFYIIMYVSIHNKMENAEK